MTAIDLDNPKLEQDIPLDRIHPDPFQPRLEPDAELADSIKSQGILQAILVEAIDATNSAERICPECGTLFAVLQVEGGHFMIQDGERRYRGSIAAGRKTALAKVVPAVTEAERLIRQLTANTGKPLTAVEEAFAFKRLMDSEGWSQAELARFVSRPRSVVGDRIRLVELDKVWLDAIAAGKLQVSHGPILSTFSAVPSEYQAKAAANFFSDYRVNQILEGGGSVPVGDMTRFLYVAFRDYIKETNKTPGYRGPTIEIKDQYSNRKSKYAADIKLWRPCFRKYENARAKERRSSGSSRSSETREPRKDLTLKLLPEITEVHTADSKVMPREGELLVYETDFGWRSQLRGVPEVFLATVDRSKLSRVYAKTSSGIVTADMVAVEKARAAFTERLKQEIGPSLGKIRKAVHDEKFPQKYAVAGPGCLAILESSERWRNPIPALALALGISLPSNGADGVTLSALTPADLNVLATGYVGWLADEIAVPFADDIADRLWERLSRNTLFRLPKSKKQEKRDARAAGEQVGDPERAPYKSPTRLKREARAARKLEKEKQVPIAAGSDRAVDVGAMRAAVEADVAEGEHEEANA